MRLHLRARDITWRSVDGRVVVLDLGHSAFSELNATGSLLWEELATGSPTRDQLAQRLVQGFGIDSERADADVERFVASLDDAGLLEPESSEG